MSTRGSAGTTGHTSPIRTAATIVGAVFVLTGIAGFIPGITTNYDALELAGHESHAKLIGLFEVSVLHNVVHLLYGLAGLALARSFSGARAYLLGGGAVYLLLWLYGILIDTEPGTEADFVPFNNADNWLHLGLGLGMIALGLVLGRDRTASARH
jgi:hypothetical protein